MLVAALTPAACDDGAAVDVDNGAKDPDITVDERDTSDASAPAPAPTDSDRSRTRRPVERVPRAQFGAVGPFPLGQRDLPAFVYPSASRSEKESLLAGLAFFTTPHTPAEGLGPVANQKMCLGCHLSSLESVRGVGLVTAASHVARAGRATPTNFRFTSLDNETGGGRAADTLDVLNGPGRTAAFTVFGDFFPTTNKFDDLKDFGGTVQHTRPSVSACLPDLIPPFAGTEGARRAVGERAGPPYIGRGLIEAIAANTILANEDPSDRKGHASSLAPATPAFPECRTDCISGRHNENTSNQAFEGGSTEVELGRFGLRAAGPTILQFVVGGINGELGFTSPFRRDELNDFINADNPDCKDGVDGLEVQSSTVLSLRQLIRLTAPPEFGEVLLRVLTSRPEYQRPMDTPEGRVQRGAALFGVDMVAFANRMVPDRMPADGDGLDRNAIQQRNRGLDCVGCHTPVQPTGASPATVGGRHLTNVWAPVFSDVLLHAGPEVTAERRASTPRDPVVIWRNGLATLDLPRNLADDALPNQGVANGREFRTAPLMGLGVIGPPFLHDARVFLSRDSVNGAPAGTVYTDATVTNAPLIVRTVDDAIRAAIEMHDLPAPDDARTTAGGGCPLPPGGVVGEVRYRGAQDICPKYDTETSKRNRSEAREVIRRYRALSPSDQQALIDFLKQL